MKNIQSKYYASFNKLMPGINLRWLILIAITVAAFITIATVKAAVAPLIPAINLSSNPLYATSTSDKPIIALAISVEYPTVGAQYLDTIYSNTNEYLGYYDAESCYTYNNAPTETPAAGLTSTDYKRFDRSGAATNRTCANAFSGNFLNWSSNSAIDMLRIALSGGDRYIDTASLTILQRAMIPNGDPICMWNSSNFPAKQLPKGANGQYLGAVPTAMITGANGNDIWVANTLNQIYFGTSNTGGCGSTSAYNLGGPSGKNIGPIVIKSQSLPNDASASCAAENGTCSFSGIKEVWYGAGQNWAVAPASNSVSCSNATFGDPISGTVKNCYTRIYTGTWTPSGGGALNSDGFFYARVKVCDMDSSGNLLDVRNYVNGNGLCTKYPNGNYKPTGSIQKYSDQLRLAAFGYLLDQTQSRYGGVLRAPMKFVGAKTFDTNGQDNTPTTGNPNAEWDSTTGVFLTNPDNDTTQTPNISGVVNYLNKFGRTGPVAGRYKIYDPVGELHYETLRYLQGLQPSATAVSNITSAMYDGFPVATSWVDPYGNGRSNTADYSCQKSNIVVVGDVNTHDGSNIPTPSASNNIPDITAWLNTVKNFESNATVNYVDGQGVTRVTGNPNTANGGTPSNQIIGSSYWAHTHDIRGTGWTNGVSQQRPGLRVKTFLFDVNEYGASNNASYRQNNNQFFMASKYGGFESTSANSKPYNTYGNPFKQQDGTNNNNVWQNPNTPGEAGTYYLQSGARGVLSAFEDIFNRATTVSKNIAGSAVASKTVTSAGSYVYQGSFDTSDWTGDVFAYPITVNSSNAISIGGSATWTAATRLSAMSTPATSRNIVIGNSGATSSPVANDFLWNSSLSTAIKTALGKVTPSSSADSNGQARLNYLRGDKSNEGSLFRPRSKLLGDIINSGITYSGTPTTGIFYSSTYPSFYSSNKNRTAAVFVGANDGMLHSFNATTGDELFAYIPSWMTSKLAALTSTTYNTSHQSYVDSTPVVAEAQVGSAGTASDWKTVLVSGTGAGGSGVFALDVTDPTAFTSSKVMWEFTRADDPDMGYVVGQPQIMRLRTSAPSATTATYRWFALVASGVNNYVPENGLYSATGNPALFLLALDKPAGAAWDSTNYYKISIPVDSTLSALNATGLANFRVTYGSAGELAQIFLGDLHGKLWKLDFSQYGAVDWNMGKLSPYKNGSTNSPIPLYIAKNSSNIIQPISMAPSIKAGPLVNGLNTYYIVFATGKYLESSDKLSTVQNSVYAVFDNGTNTTDSTGGSSIITDRARLQVGTANASTGIITVPAFIWGRATSSTDATQRSGWYFDFPTLGEREVSSGTVSGSTLIFSSLIPAAAGSTASCTTADGSGNSYYLNIETGNGTSVVSTVGLLGESIVLSLDTATTSTISATTGRRQTTKTTTSTQSGTKGAGATTSTPVVITSGRLSWRQINNYQDLIH